MNIYPLKLSGAQVSMIWGGDALYRIYGKGDGKQLIGESWEVSSREEAPSTIENGPLLGQTLRSAFERWAEQLTGRADFPLLIKILDARDRLSVQVHPGDRGDLPGKTEAWVVLHAEPGAKLVYGLKEGVDAAAFEAAVQAGTVEQCIRWQSVSPGDVLFIPAGTVHAVGAGMMLYEVQQNSNTTYRLYDWGRVDAQGNARELHLGEGLAVTDYGPVPVLPPAEERVEGDARIARHIACHAFVLETVSLDGTWEAKPGGVMLALTCLDGSGRVEGEFGFDFTAGDSFVLPAALDAAVVSGNARLALSFAPHTQ